jgi:hypothetical protein
MLLLTHAPSSGGQNTDDYELTHRGTRFKVDDSTMMMVVVIRGDESMVGMLQRIESEIHTIASEDLPGLELVQEICCPICAQGQHYVRLRDQRLINLTTRDDTTARNSSSNSGPETQHRCPFGHTISTTEIIDGLVVRQRDTVRNHLWDPLLRERFFRVGQWSQPSANLYTTVLTQHETHKARSLEFNRARAWFDQYVAADSQCVTYELDRVVFLRNPKLEEEFAAEFRHLAAKAMSIEMDWLTGLLKDDDEYLNWNANDSEESRRRRIGVLRHLDSSVLRFSGNEGVNAIMVYTCNPKERARERDRERNALAHVQVFVGLAWYDA